MDQCASIRACCQCVCALPLPSNSADTMLYPKQVSCFRYLSAVKVQASPGLQGLFYFVTELQLLLAAAATVRTIKIYIYCFSNQFIQRLRKEPFFNNPLMFHYHCLSHSFSLSLSSGGVLQNYRPLILHISSRGQNMKR